MLNLYSTQKWRKQLFTIFGIIVVLSMQYNLKEGTLKNASKYLKFKFVIKQLLDLFRAAIFNAYCNQDGNLFIECIASFNAKIIKNLRKTPPDFTQEKKMNLPFKPPVLMVKSPNPDNKSAPESDDVL